MQEPVGIVVLGLGRAGSIHACNVLANPRAKLRWIVEEDVQKAKKFLGDRNVTDVGVVPVADTRIALDDQQVRAALVCTPTNTHSKVIVDCLRAGKAVFCEKPVAEDVESIVSCYEEADRLGLLLFCSYNRRFDPGHGTVIKKARTGALGTIHSIITKSRDSPFPTLEFLKISGGMFHDCATHDIDVVLRITGEAPTTVYAQASSFAPAIADMGDVDCITITLKFPRGTLATINLDRTSPYGYDQRLEVMGDKAMMISDNPKPSAIRVYSQEGENLDKCHYSFPQRYAESYKNSLNHFLNVIEGKEEIEVTKEQVVLACQVADACELSHKTQQVVNFKI
ncbi:uncharacterized protein LOC116302393 [Actinia tenebrosa]|uniref:Uncharacterized protein LOC116302393 n=1 Tax=Actinia tenebrosa TaxID=6105 RepID=A0A6P8IMC5_ACTTE|nr:uncharacterized protein LOC116302393 [Actinia tenebrosa]